MTDKAREGHLRRKYGITTETYEKLLEAQSHSCGVCSKHESTFAIRLAVDHNHRTGEIRGLLCAYCNHRLVGRHTDPELLQAVVDYLRNSTGLFVPKKKRRRKASGRKPRGQTTRPKSLNPRHRVEAN
jgi:hypothetical protein